MCDHSVLPVVVISCKVFQNFIEKYLPNQLVSQITFLDYGLHSFPKKLRITIQEMIDQIDSPSLIILGYGLCGNGLDGIHSRQHTLLIPKTDDCIAILLGSYADYLREFSQNPGTYYLSKGWLESGSNPLQEYESYVARFGLDKADFLMDVQYKNYRRLAFVAHQPEDFLNLRWKALSIAEFCKRWGMKYEEITGSDRYLRSLAEIADSYQDAGEDFIVVGPGKELKQRDFIRG